MSGMEVGATVKFEPYRLDLVDESLWRYGERLNLTPKQGNRIMIPLDLRR